MYLKWKFNRHKVLNWTQKVSGSRLSLLISFLPFKITILLLCIFNLIPISSVLSFEQFVLHEYRYKILTTTRVTKKILKILQKYYERYIYIFVTDLMKYLAHQTLFFITYN